MRWAALGFNLHQYPVDDYVDRIYLIGFEIKDTLDTARETTKENTWTISISTWQNCGGKKRIETIIDRNMPSLFFLMSSFSRKENWGQNERYIIVMSTDTHILKNILRNICISYHQENQPNMSTSINGNRI